MGKTYVQLSKLGDICTLLPLLYADSQKGEKPRLMVAREFSSILEGVSYVEPVIFEGAPQELDKAVAQLNGDPYVVTQVNGPADLIRKYTYGPANQDGARASSFAKEQWKVCGRLKEWDLNLPLVFDRRDKEREQALLDKIPLRSKTKLILVSLGGNTSPFPYKPLLMTLLELRFKLGYQIVDLSTVKADRFYDLLALYDKAYCLVASDSAPLHLSWACPNLPVLALTNDKPILWNGSPWRPNHLWYCRYSDFPHRAPEMVEAISQLKNRPKPTQETQFIHVWNAYQKIVRFNYADPNWIPTPIQLGSCGRDSGNMFGDAVRLPMFKDALRMGMQRAKEDDVIIVSRPDTVFNESIQWQANPAYAYRMENGTYHPVIDMLCASKRFWKSILDEIPDLVFGKDIFWGDVVRGIFQRNNALNVTGCCYRNLGDD